MSRVCFGQNFEDVVLWRALGGVANGRYLDIGAQHPEIDSVSLSFYREGWRGVHVEPAPQYAAMLRDARPDEPVIQAAAGDGGGLIKLHIIPDTGLSTGVGSISEGHRAAGFSPNSTDVPVVSLQALLDRFAGEYLHWLKIDVEGMEESVLRSWGNSFVRPWIVLIDAIDPITQAPNENRWRGLIEQRQYHEVLFDGVSRFFVADERSDLDAAFTAPANCLDRYFVPWHHWSAANVVHQFRDQIESLAQVGIERDDARQSLAQAVTDRDALIVRLDDLGTERVLLSDAIKALKYSLESRTADLARMEGQHRHLIELSQTLAAQLDVANGRIAAQARDHSAELQGAFLEMQALRQQIKELLDTSEIYQGQLHKADEIVTLSLHHHASPFVRLLSFFSPSSRRRQRRLAKAISAWTQRAPIFPGRVKHRLTSEVSLMDIFAFEHRNPYLRANSLEELCRFADADFVRCAYVTILGRQPDPDGERRYTARLRQGASKLAVISDLRRSGEGKLHDPGIGGLDKALRQHRNANRPIIGWIVRLWTGREGNGPVERRLRALTNMFEVEQNRAAARASTANHLQLTLDAKVNTLHKELRAALAGRSASANQISQAEAAGDTEWKATLNSVLNG